MTNTTPAPTDSLTAPVAALIAAFDAAGAVISAAENADPNLPTPCDEFTVADLLAHLNSVGLRIAGMGHGRPASSVPDSTVEADGRYADAWARHRADVVPTWASLPDDAELISPWRPLNREDAAGIYAAEVVVHSWDLAVAVGAPFAVDDDVAEVCIAAVSAELPPDSRADIYDAVKAQLPEGFPWVDPYGPALDAPTDASAMDRLAAVSGRSPRWSA